MKAFKHITADFVQQVRSAGKQRVVEDHQSELKKTQDLTMEALKDKLQQMSERLFKQVRKFADLEFLGPKKWLLLIVGPN